MSVWTIVALVGVDILPCLMFCCLFVIFFYLVVVGSMMEGSDDVDVMTEFWEADLDEDGARKDRMPPPLPMSTGMFFYIY